MNLMPFDFRRMTFKEYSLKRRGYYNKEARRQDHDRVLMRRLIYVVAGLGYGSKSPFADESDIFSVSWEENYKQSQTEKVLASYPDPDQQERIAQAFSKAFQNNGHQS